jgi:uncharacterized protein (DUF1501 family)
MPQIITRRNFLGRSLQLALASVAGAHLNVPLFLRQALAQGEIRAGARKILFIFLRGGNDAINTVIPWADEAYNPVNRPTLHITGPDPLSRVPGRSPEQPDLSRVIDLGNGFAGLHPALRDLCPLHNAGELACVHRVGYSKQSRSHFDSQRYWENGVPRNDMLRTGIFYRALMETGLHEGREFPGVSVQQGSSPLLLRGPQAMVNLSDPNRYDLHGVAGGGGDREKQLAAIAAAHAMPHPAKHNRHLLFPTGQSLRGSIEGMKSIGLESNDFFDTDGVTRLFPINAASNQKQFRSSAYRFFQNLKVAAQVLAGTDAVITGTELGGFDTHNSQGTLTGTHAERLEWLGWGIYALRQYFTSSNPRAWEDVLIVTLSEFGRTTKENGSLGTDHAEAGVMFVAGGKVKGGVYQCENANWTTGQTGALFQVNSRYLRRTVDYRSVFGEIIRKHLGASQEQLNEVIPGYADPRENLLAGGNAPDGTRIVGELGLV